MKAIEIHGDRLITSQPTFKGKLIRLFERRDGAWFESAHCSPFPGGPDWTPVDSELNRKLSAFVNHAPARCRP